MYPGNGQQLARQLQTDRQQSAEACRESQVTSQLNRTRIQLEQLEGTVGTLINRLNGVSQSQAPSTHPGEINKAPREVLVPLAEEISCVTSRIELLHQAVSDQLRRLEV